MKEIKQKSRNATTERSKQLRRESARKSNAKLTAANRLEIKNQDAAKITAIRAGLAEVAGKDNAEKLLLLLDVYKNHQSAK